MLVPTLRVVTPPVTLRVTILKADAERPGLHSHAERGNDRRLAIEAFARSHAPRGNDRSAAIFAIGFQLPQRHPPLYRAR